jgi:hypothetical protein
VDDYGDPRPTTSGSRPLPAGQQANQGAMDPNGNVQVGARAQPAPTPVASSPSVARYTAPERARGLFDTFARNVAHATSAGSIGVLPLVTWDYRRTGSSVTELGVRVADDIATGVVEGGYGGQVLGPAGLEARLAELNMDKRSISTLGAVAQEGDRLGVDAVVFGTIKRQVDNGANGRETLDLAVSAYDFATSRLVAQDEIEVASDREENRTCFDLANRDSLWMPGDRWQVPEAPRTFDREIAAVTDILARRLAGSIDVNAIAGATYIPTTDTAPYARAANAPPGTGSRFGAQLSTMLGEKLRPKLAGHELRVLDAGLAQPQDAPVVEQGLAAGAVSTGSPAARALGASGIGLVAVPRLERFGPRYSLRVEVYDLRTGKLAASTHAPIDARFEPDLAHELGVASTTAPEPVPAPAIAPPPPPPG